MVNFNNYIEPYFPENNRKFWGALHDGFCHYFLRDLTFAPEFMNAYGDVVSPNLDFSELATSAADYYTTDLKKNVADIVYQVPYRNGRKDLTISIVVEHKAQSSAKDNERTSENLLLYVLNETLEGRKRLKRHKMESYQAVPLLIYTGPDRYFVAPKWERIFLLPDDMRRFSIKYDVPCVNLTKLYLEGKLVGTPMVRVFCTIMACAGLGILKEKRKTLFEPLNGYKEFDEDTKKKITACVFYILKVSDNRGEPFTDEEYRELLACFTDIETRDIMNAIFEGTLFEEVARDGEKRGEKRGEKKGEKKERLKNFMQCLTRKYPKRPDDLDSQIRRLKTSSQFEQLFNLLMDGASIEKIAQCVQDFLTSSNSKRVRAARA